LLYTTIVILLFKGVESIKSANRPRTILSHTLLGNTNLFTINADHNGHIYDATPNVFSAFGLSVSDDEINSNATLDDVLAKMKLPSLMRKYAKVKNGDINECELDIAYPGDAYLGCSIEKSVHGHITVTFTDITEAVRKRDKVERELHANEMALQLYTNAIAGLSHDLGNDITALSYNCGNVGRALENFRSCMEGMAAFLKSIQEDDKDNQIAKVLLQILDENSKTMGFFERSKETAAAIVERLERKKKKYLNLSLVESGKYNPEIKEVGLYNDIILPVHNEMQMLYPNRAYEIGISPDSHPIHEQDVKLHLDDFAVQTAYENLISNAIKYGGHGTKITVSYAEKHPEVHLSIKNTGSYLTPDEMGMLFQRFKRVPRHSNICEGHGFGLFLARTLLLYSKGDIRVNSDNQTYTEFTISLTPSFIKA
jgi:signal transduction histidine kinase